MKITVIISMAGFVFTPMAFAEPHNHKKQDEKKEHGDHHGHDHGANKQGPNHGKLITDLEPHLEFFITKDHKVQLTFVDDHNKVVAKPDASFSMICGDRAKPTKLTFEKTLTGYISKEKLPDGKNIPTVLRVKSSKDGKTETIRFNINLNDCPGCEFLEYACTCDHDH